MSTTTEIPRKEWQEFFDNFSHMHVGWRVSMEVLDEETGVGYEARDMTLDGVLSDIRHGQGDITVLLGDVPEDHMAHSIAHPTHVRLRQSDSGADEVLQLESEGSTTLLYFNTLARPDELDGIAARSRTHRL